MRTVLAASLVFLTAAATAAERCLTDKDCGAQQICVCVRHLIAEAGRCDEMRGFCSVDKPEFAPQRRALEAAKARSSISGKVPATAD
jgi:hypothetical protein